MWGSNEYYYIEVDPTERSPNRSGMRAEGGSYSLPIKPGIYEMWKLKGDELDFFEEIVDTSTNDGRSSASYQESAKRRGATASGVFRDAGKVPGANKGFFGFGKK